MNKREQSNPELADIAEGSTEHERLLLQERDPFDDFMEHIDQGAERREPTAAEKEKMDANLVQLGKLFEGTDISWHLDGALNISLMRGEYIGIHKDVDISIEAGELEKLDRHLESRGYGLFLSRLKDPAKPRGKKIMERVDAGKFFETSSEHPMIAAIDDQGRIREDVDLNFVDTHIVERDDDGNPLGWGQTPLPSEWFDPQTTIFQDTELNTSHPAKVAYFKLHGARSYDRTDLRLLAESGGLSMVDVDLIESKMREEFERRSSGSDTILSGIAGRLQSDMNADEIFSIFASDPVVSKSLNKIESEIRELSRRIEESGDVSLDGLKLLAAEIFSVPASFDEQEKKIQELRNWMK